MRLGQGDDGRRVDQSGRIQAVGIHNESKIEEGWIAVKKIRENISGRGKRADFIGENEGKRLAKKAAGERENEGKLALRKAT